MRDAPTCHLADISVVCLGLSLSETLLASVKSPRLHRFSRSVLNGCRFLISAWACKSTLRVHTSRHVISGTRPSRSLFLHGCEMKAGVGRTGNEASISAGYYVSAVHVSLWHKWTIPLSTLLLS